MRDEPESPSSGDLGAGLESFVKRLERLDAVLRIITRDAPLSVIFTFRGEPERRALLDLSRRPCRVTTGDEARGGHVKVAVSARVMHRVFLGGLTAAEALGRRELLLRGSAYHISRFVPLFDLAPPLYRDHLRDHRRSAGSEEETMNDRDLERPWERHLVEGINVAAYGLGYGLGLLRYRWIQRIDLFEVLESISRGLDDAASRELPDPSRTHATAEAGPTASARVR